MSDELVWLPLEGRRAGVVAIVLTSFASILSVVTLLSICTFYLIRHQRLPPPQQRVSAESHLIKFARSEHFILLANLLAGDLIKALGFSLNVVWLARGRFPSDQPDGVCTAQGVLTQMGDTASVFGDLLIAFHIASLLIMSYKPSRRTIYSAITISWILVVILVSVGPGAVAVQGHPFFGWSGGWCWISSYPPYQLYKVWLLHLWIFTCGLLVIGLYVTITIKLVVDGKRTSATATSSGYVSIARSMLCFPLVYLITVLPLSIYRIAALRGHRLPDSAILAAGAIFTSSGYVNCTVYAITRNLVRVDGAFNFIKRSLPGSGSSERPKPARGKRANQGVFVTTQTEVAFDEHRVSFDGIRFTSNSKSSKVPRAQIESVDDDKVANVELDSLEQWADRPQ